MTRYSSAGVSAKSTAVVSDPDDPVSAGRLGLIHHSRKGGAVPPLPRRVHEQLFGVCPPGQVLGGDGLLDVGTAVALPVALSRHVSDLGVHVAVRTRLRRDEALAGHGDPARIERRGLGQDRIALNELKGLEARARYTLRTR